MTCITFNSAPVDIAPTTLGKRFAIRGLRDTTFIATHPPIKFEGVRRVGFDTGLDGWFVFPLAYAGVILIVLEIDGCWRFNDGATTFSLDVVEALGARTLGLAT